MAPDNSLNLELARHRVIAIERLTLVTSLPADECRETFLFENDRFCGVRWTLGGAKAIWRTGTDGIACEPGNTSVQQASVVRRAA